VEKSRSLEMVTINPAQIRHFFTMYILYERLWNSIKFYADTSRTTSLPCPC
jgi:hypothetical protein